jgi:hypothetical protein
MMHSEHLHVRSIERPSALAKGLMNIELNVPMLPMSVSLFSVSLSICLFLSLTQVDQEVWATVLALVWLYGFKMEAQEEWQFLAMKAVSWIQAQKGSYSLHS